MNYKFIHFQCPKCGKKIIGKPGHIIICQKCEKVCKETKEVIDTSLEYRYGKSK